MSRLRTDVHVSGDDGAVHIFTPADAVPTWAVKKITNPAAWAEEPEDDSAPPAGDPSEAWTVAELKAWAADPEHPVDLGEATKKADILAVITESREQ
ncbi:hypothetical protein [Nocardia sp. N2S4-5]|uniref:hypothetical protein n=1 Tax=Nocardia sp. N2S4-5 TaxID=3351565 RepID=UPI0037D0B065